MVYNPDTGIPEENVGLILQRGGEELNLFKAEDRFTVALNSEINLTEDVPAVAQYTLPLNSVDEIRVEPAVIEEAMETARELETVAYASHVYQLENNPEALIYLTDELTVQFSSSLPSQERDAITSTYGLAFVKAIEELDHTFVYRVTSQARENPLKIANRLLGEQQISTAETNILIQQDSFYRPQDTYYGQQWYLNHNGGSFLAANSHIDAEKAWEITKGERSIVVAITDDAIDVNHPDFQGPGKIVAPRDFKDKDFIPLPEASQESHGTSCAGVAVAEETGDGVVGVAPGCALMPLRTTGFLDDNSIEQLFSWVVDNGASVISCSWGAAAVRFPLSLRQKAAINRAAVRGRDGKGCVVVFAAGNANRPVNGTVYERNWQENLLNGPTEWLSGFAAHPDVIAVSACTSLGKKSAYSNWGTNISVCAPSNNAPPGMWFQKTGYISTGPKVTSSLPGLGIFTTDLLGQLGYHGSNFTHNFGGTSSACPVVAGVAGLVLSVNPDLSAQQVRQILQQSADKIVDTNPDPQLGLRMGTYDNNGFCQWFGYGKVNAFKAVKAAQLTLKTQSPSRTLHKSNNSPIAIPDNNWRGISSNMRISEAGIVKDIQVTVNITHQFLGDLEINLVSPTGQTILLQSRTLGAKTELQKIYNLKTAPILQEMLEQPAKGTWHLKVVDSVAEDQGTLNSWDLVLKF